jgi:hypothetical protein
LCDFLDVRFDFLRKWYTGGVTKSNTIDFPI